MTTRSQHGIFKPNPKYSQALTITTISPLPKNPIHALRDPNWKKAIQEEYDALIANHTWDLVPCPTHVNVICSL